MPQLSALDHLVLTVASIPASVTFYETALGMRAERFDAIDGTTRVGLVFGLQRINLHEAGQEFEPKARQATPGSADLCFLTETPLADWADHLSGLEIPIVDGPVKRTGAIGPIRSIYLRDPDGNLIELSNQLRANARS